MILPIILALFGLILIYIEFFIPGGIMGLFGGLLVIASIIVVLISDLNIIPLVLFIIITFTLLIVTVKIALFQVKKTGKKGTIFLESDQKGYFASKYEKDLIGRYGIAGSDLKPSGYVIINDRSYQAVSKGKYITKGKNIQVLAGEGARLIVKEKTKE
jgi:membrane-bound ClpP family serine protease